MYTMEYYSAIKKEWNIYNNMDGPKEYHSKWSQTEKDKCYTISLIHGFKIKRN